jgi:hypothetical protein
MSLQRGASRKLLSIVEWLVSARAAIHCHEADARGIRAGDAAD